MLIKVASLGTEAGNGAGCMLGRGRWSPKQEGRWDFWNEMLASHDCHRSEAASIGLAAMQPIPSLVGSAFPSPSLSGKGSIIY